MTDNKTEQRCLWCNMDNPLYVEYHDSQWGVPRHDDRQLFEMLVLEMFQAGLSWETILNKRENFRRAFDNFDCEKVSRYGREKTERLMADSSIVRNRKKIEAAVNNAKIFIEIQKEWGSFDKYLWHFTRYKTIVERGLTKSDLSGAVAKDLKARGMKFLGSTTIYSYLQATGVIFSHDENCFVSKSHRL